VILYFDTSFNTSIATSVGLTGVSINNAAMYNMQSNPDFGKSLFAALLAAQARGATISVQMSSVLDGYLVMDRIWVNEYAERSLGPCGRRYFEGRDRASASRYGISG